MLEIVAAGAKAWIKENMVLTKELGTETLLLRYGLGGVNYAHHDNSGNYQAVLLLSSPGIDFAGGDFFVAESKAPYTKVSCPFQNAGDLILFCGDEYLHGMDEIKQGSGQTTRRIAVGLFQGAVKKRKKSSVKGKSSKAK